MPCVSTKMLFESNGVVVFIFAGVRYIMCCTDLMYMVCFTYKKTT